MTDKTVPCMASVTPASVALAPDLPEGHFRIEGENEFKGYALESFIAAGGECGLQVIGPDGMVRGYIPLTTGATLRLIEGLAGNLNAIHARRKDMR